MNIDDDEYFSSLTFGVLFAALHLFISFLFLVLFFPLVLGLDSLITII